MEIRVKLPDGREGVLGQMAQPQDGDLYLTDCGTHIWTADKEGVGVSNYGLRHIITPIERRVDARARAAFPFQESPFVEKHMMAGDVWRAGYRAAKGQ